MAALTSSLIVKLIDGISGPAKKAAGSLTDLNRAATGGGSFDGRMASRQSVLADAIARNNAELATARAKLFDAAAALYLFKRALGAPLDAAKNFETMLEDIGQKADIPVERLGALGAQIKQVARDTNQATSDIGQAVDFLVGMGAAQEVALTVSGPIGKAATAYRAATEDLAKATFAVVDNLKTPAEDAAFALDIMARAGKGGGFELRDMAKEFPALTASAQFLGMTGTAAVADLAAALEVARKGAADGAQAANNMANFFQKLTTKETLKNFGKAGVDVMAELEYAAQKGISPVEHMLQVLDRVTDGGQADKVAAIFGDKQVLEFIKPMMANMDEYRRIRESALAAQGTVEEDYARRIQTAEGVQKRFSAAMENLNTSIGMSLIPTINRLLDTIIPVMDTLGQWIDQHPDLTGAILATVSALVAMKVAAAGLTFVGLIGKGGALSMLAGGLGFVRWAGTPVAGMLETLAMRASLATAATGKAPGALARLGDALIVMGGNLVKPLGGLKNLAMWAGRLSLPLMLAAGAAKFVVDNLAGITAMFDGIGDGFLANIDTSGLERLGEAFAPLGNILKPVADAMGAIWSFIAGDSFKIDASTEQWKGWGVVIGETVAGGVNTLIGGIERLIGFLTAAWQGVTDLGTAISNLWNSGGSAPSGKKCGDLGGDPSLPDPSKPLDGARASGGPVWSGGSFLVGENEPEVFTPGQSGHITPLSRLGGGPISIGPFHFSGLSGDPHELGRVVRRAINEEINGLLRGAHADAEARYA